MKHCICPAYKTKQTTIGAWFIENAGYEQTLEGESTNAPPEFSGNSDFDAYACSARDENLPPELVEKLNL